MSSPENQHVPFHEQHQHSEHEPDFYSLAARFKNERPAGRAYGRLQASVYARTDCDLSVYRLQLNRIYHVAVLGQTPPEDLARRIRRILSTGELTALPPEAMAALVARRLEQVRHGPWSEGHHRPGLRL